MPPEGNPEESNNVFSYISYYAAEFWLFLDLVSLIVNFEVGTLKNLYQRSLTWHNLNILKFSFGNLEMRHKIELHVDNNWGNITLFQIQKETLPLQYANKLLT